MVQNGQPFIQMFFALLSQHIQPACRSTVTGVPFGANKSILFKLSQSAIERGRRDLGVRQGKFGQLTRQLVAIGMPLAVTLRNFLLPRKFLFSN